jgi:hypothetical protein
MTNLAIYEFMQLATTDGTPRKALITACVVGTILTTINHGDLILQGDFPPLIKVALTYCVPFCVTTWGAVLGKKSRHPKEHRSGG